MSVFMYILHYLLIFSDFKLTHQSNSKFDSSLIFFSFLIRINIVTIKRDAFYLLHLRLKNYFVSIKLDFIIELILNYLRYFYFIHNLPIYINYL
jgi:hypothetical protein